MSNIREREFDAAGKVMEEAKNLRYKRRERHEAIDYIEKNYPQTAKEFQRLQFEQWLLFCKKQMDYGPSNISMGTSLRTQDEKRLSLVGLIVESMIRFRD